MGKILAGERAGECCWKTEGGISTKQMDAVDMKRYQLGGIELLMNCKDMMQIPELTGVLKLKQEKTVWSNLFDGFILQTVCVLCKKVNIRSKTTSTETNFGSSDQSQCYG